MNKGNLTRNGVHLQEHEFSTINALLESGYNIELIPPSQIKGMYLPDININGISWEIKAPKGNSRNTIKHSFQNALHQSQNIILDLRRCKLQQSIAIKEAELHFKLSKRVQRMKIIIYDEQSLRNPAEKHSIKPFVILDYKKK